MRSYVDACRASREATCARTERTARLAAAVQSTLCAGLGRSPNDSGRRGAMLEAEASQARPRAKGRSRPTRPGGDLKV